MKHVKVIVAGGVTLAGPMKVRLSKAQHARRAHILGEASKSGVYTLDGDQKLSFKLGEVFGVDGLSKLNKGLFEEVTSSKAKAGSKAKKAAGDQKTAHSDGPDTGAAATGSNTPSATGSGGND